MGAMRGTAYIKNAETDVKTACASLVRDHSKAFNNHGLTREYVGFAQASVSNIRVDRKFEDRLGPKFAASPMVDGYLGPSFIFPTPSISTSNTSLAKI